MPFDADAFRAECSGWEVTLGGRTYRSGYVSLEQVRAFEDAAQGAPAGGENKAIAMRRLLRGMFPYRLEYLWLGDPVARIMRLDGHSRGKILAEFFDWRLRIHAPDKPGTSSQPQHRH